MDPEKKILEHTITKITKRGNSETSVVPRIIRLWKLVRHVNHLEWFFIEENEYAVFCAHLDHKLVVFSENDSIIIKCDTCEKVLKTIPNKTEQYFVVDTINEELAKKKENEKEEKE